MAPVRRNPRRACTKPVPLSTASPSSSSSSEDKESAPSPPRRKVQACGPNRPKKTVGSSEVLSAPHSSHSSRRKPSRQRSANNDESDRLFESIAGGSARESDDGEDFEMATEELGEDDDDDDDVQEHDLEEDDVELDDIYLVAKKHSRRSSKARTKHSTSTDVDTRQQSTPSGPNDDNDASSNQLSDVQSKLLDSLFATFDPHSNGRITVTDLMRVADDHGIDYTPEEARDMIHFWDSSGLASVSRDKFTQIALDSKFVVLPTK